MSQDEATDFYAVLHGHVVLHDCGTIIEVSRSSPAPQAGNKREPAAQNSGNDVPLASVSE